jgi:hypothetical protein
LRGTRRRPAASSATSTSPRLRWGGNQEAAGSFGEISVTKAEVGNKEAADSFTGEIGVTKAEVGNKEAAGSFTGEIGVTKDELGNKEAAGPGMVTEASWINFVFLTKPPAGIERKAEPTVAMITKETVPDSFIDILKKRPLFKKLPPVNETSHLYSRFPELRDIHLSGTARRNYCIDLHEDVLRQHKLKGFAEVGVDFTDGVKKIFILPH